MSFHLNNNAPECESIRNDLFIELMVCVQKPVHQTKRHLSSTNCLPHSPDLVQFIFMQSKIHLLLISKIVLHATINAHQRVNCFCIEIVYTSIGQMGCLMYMEPMKCMQYLHHELSLSLSLYRFLSFLTKNQNNYRCRRQIMFN